MSAKQANVAVSIEQLKNHKINGFEPENIVNAVILSKNKGIPINFDSAVTLHIAGKNPLYCVKQCLTPQVISTKDFVCHTENGDSIKAEINLTLQKNSEKLLDGKDEEYFFNKLLNVVYDTVGKYGSLKDLKQSQKEICERVIDERPDYNTVYCIKSLRIEFRAD